MTFQNPTFQTTISKRRNKHIVVYVMGGIISAVMIWYGIVSFHISHPTLPQVNFDPQKVVRLEAVTRVFMIRQDPLDTAMLWFATAQGLRVLDTRTFEWARYGLEHGLPSEYIYDLCFKEGTPWIATAAGVARYDSAQHRFLSVKVHGRTHPLAALAIVAVSGAGVFFSGDSAGFYQVTSGDSIAHPLVIPGIEPTVSSACLRVVDSSLYVGIVGRTFVRYSPFTKKIKQMVFKGNRSFANTFVWDIVRHQGRVYVGTSDDGLWSGPIGSDTLTEMHDFPGKGVYSISVEPDGLWCGTPYGLWRYYSDGGAWIHFINPEEKQLTDFQVFTLASANSYLWYGTADKGAGSFNTKQVEWQRMRAGLSEENVSVLAPIDSSLWVGYGYKGGGLDRFGEKEMQYYRNYGSIDGIADSHISSIYGSQGVVYYGTFGGFGYIDTRQYAVRYFDSQRDIPHGDVAQIIPEDSLNLLLASSSGVLRFSINTEKFSVIAETQGGRITTMSFIGDRFWYGVLGKGFFSCDRTYHDKQGPFLSSSRRVSGIYPVSVGKREQLCILTRDNGAYIFDPLHNTQQPLHIPKGVLSEGFAHYKSQIMASRMIDGYLWIGTREHGCVIWHVASGSWSTFSFTDGLISNQIRSINDNADAVWVGCYGGISKIDKKYLSDQKWGTRAKGLKKG